MESPLLWTAGERIEAASGDLAQYIRTIPLPPDDPTTVVSNFRPIRADARRLSVGHVLEGDDDAELQKAIADALGSPTDEQLVVVAPADRAWRAAAAVVTTSRGSAREVFVVAEEISE